MCLPCWPVKDITLEDDPPARRQRLFQYVWDADKREWVPTIGHRSDITSRCKPWGKYMCVTRS
ncbi:hypothetical protein PG990_006389 [Apiospora arundinis]|uniref:Uncharacterized protein n=1 Tax=Apiospora arundinis TaxID=335852 RepID=A0ABR2JAA2_9PEZI